MMRIFAVVMLALLVPTHEQGTPLSPCPNVFKYEKATETDRWDGEITLNVKSPQYTLFLTVALDKKAELLGNWIGEVTTNDNKVYRIESTDTAIYPGKPVKVKFYVKYNIFKGAPLLQKIKLNGVEICNADIPLPALDTGLPTPPAQIIETPSTRSVQTNTPPSLIPIDFETHPVEPSAQKEVASPVFTPPMASANPVSVDGGAGLADNNIPETPKPVQHQCGARVLGKPLIIDGTPTQEGEWPWHVALYRLEAVDSIYACGGTLVSHRHIVSAAHCLIDKNTNQVGKPSTFSVFLGKFNLVTSIRGVQFSYIKKIKIHEEFDPTSVLNDIAILETLNRITYSSWVQPACLWPENLIDLSNIIGKYGSVVGWGYTGEGTSAVELLRVDIPVVDPLVCLQSYPAFYERFVTDYTYCAGLKNGSSPCNGDSGGGMMFRLGQFWYLRGLVSVAVQKPNERLCDPKHYIVFTDVAKFLPWIKSIVTDY